jgi:DNA-binding CsgD family transcriptional regulator
LVGRGDELATLRAAVAALAAGRGGIVWLDGEPGIGKSALVGYALEQARGLPCQVFRAVASELGQQLPMRALTDALGTRLAAEAGLPLVEGESGEAQASVPAAVERFLALVDRLCADRPVVFVLDDLQWADEASLTAWYRLSLAVQQIPLLLLSAARPVPARPSVLRLRREVVERGGTLLEVGPLAEQDTVALLGGLADGRPGPRLRRAAVRAGGNPLYTRELVDALRRQSRLRAEDGGGVELVGTVDTSPAALGEAIRSRLDFLSDDAATTLRVAALLGAQFSAFDLATATGRAGTVLLPVLDEAVAAGVLAEVEGRLAFRHDLIRQALYEAVPHSVRQALHRQIAQALATTGLPQDQIAAHLLAAAPDALDGWAVDWVAAQARQLGQRAPDLAAELLPHAERRAGPEHPGRVALLHGLAKARRFLNERDGSEAAAREAIAASHDPTETAELTLDLVDNLSLHGRYEDCLVAINTALANPGTDPRWRARLLGLRARVLGATDAWEEGRRTGWQALAESERLGDAIGQAYALWALQLIADHTDGLAYVDRALAAVGNLPETAHLRIPLLTNSAYNLYDIGQPEPAQRRMQDALILAERIGSWRVTQVRSMAGNLYIDTGRWDDALAVLEPTGEQFGLHERIYRWGGVALIAAHRDERRRCAELLAGIADLPELAGFMRGNVNRLYMARAVQAEQRGGPAAGLGVLAGILAADDDGPDLYNRYLWLPDMARLALAADEPESARTALVAAEIDAQAEALPRRVAVLQHIRALLGADIDTLLELATRYRTLGSPLGVGQCYEEAALLLARAGNQVEARATLTKAAGAYADLGARWDIRRADARLRGFGVRRGPNSGRRQPLTGWDALTPTEMRVAALVAEGHSNPDIAAELLTSRNTVQTHVSHILTKLGYTSRIEIAREVDRRSLARSGA